MPLLAVGISHNSAPIDLLERFALTPPQTESMLERLADYTNQVVVLATCNRTEIYASAQHPEIGAQHFLRFLAQWGGGDWEAVAPHLYAHTQWNALRHLFDVAAGLDSMVVGEEQILGQVRAAAEQARSRGSLDSVLGKAFQQAVRVGRRVRSETDISRNATSVSSVAVKLAERHLGPLENVHALLISAGEAGKLASRSLVGQGVRHLEVTNRSHQRALVLAERTGGVAIPFDDLDEALYRADLVITATSSPEHLLTLPRLAHIVGRRPDRPLVCIDIAMPRDVDPEVTKLPSVSLYNIEDVQQYVESNLKFRTKEADKATVIIDDELRRFQAWWRNQTVLPTIAALRRKAEAIREQELRKTWRKLPDLTEAERASVEAMTKAIAKKLFHEPFIYLKEQRESEDSLSTVHALFGLDEPGEPEHRPSTNGNGAHPEHSVGESIHDPASAGNRHS